jgi:hypothetical protein
MLTSANIITLQQRGQLNQVLRSMKNRKTAALRRMRLNVPAEHLIGMVHRLEENGISITPHQLDEAMQLVPLARNELIDDYGTDVTEEVITALAMIFLGCVPVRPTPPEFFEILNQAIQYVYQ